MLLSERSTVVDCTGAVALSVGIVS